MARKVSPWSLAVLGLTASAASHASLIGVTVTETNTAVPTFSGTHVIGDGIERSDCLIPAVPNCLLGVELDYGADYIDYGSFNRTPNSATVQATNLIHTFDDSITILGAELIANDSPLIIALSFTAHTITYVVDSYLWEANSVYSNRVLVRTGVAEPGMLTLLGASVLGILAFSRRRARKP